MTSGRTTGGPSACAPSAPWPVRPGSRRPRSWPDGTVSEPSPRSAPMVATQERTLSAWQDQVRARVHIAGSGPPLVFFHGAFGLRWDPFLDALAERCTVYAPEHPGTTPGEPDAVR